MTGFTASPASVEQLTQLLAAACAKKERIARVDLSALNRVMEYTPEDMTVTVQTGITLAALQAELGHHRQWLPLDPPHAESVSLYDIINDSLSGPRRCGCGTIRDYIIGMTVALADGTLTHSGGKVVKNVAGYDLMKLFIGARATLGVPVEVNLKLRPLPEAEKFVEAKCASLENACALIEAVMQSEATPVVLDLHNLGMAASPSSHPSPPVGEKVAEGRLRGHAQTADIDNIKPTPFTLVIGFAGTHEEVDWQIARAAELGCGESSSLRYSMRFWSDATPAQKISVLPSKLIDALRGLNGTEFIARAGNGVIYHRGPAAAREKLPVELMRRVKNAYDPNHVFPELPT